VGSTKLASRRAPTPPSRLCDRARGLGAVRGLDAPSAPLRRRVLALEGRGRSPLRRLCGRRADRGPSCRPCGRTLRPAPNSAGWARAHGGRKRGLRVRGLCAGARALALCAGPGERAFVDRRPRLARGRDAARASRGNDRDRRRRVALRGAARPSRRRRRRGPGPALGLLRRCRALSPPPGLGAADGTDAGGSTAAACLSGCVAGAGRPRRSSA
jgi:hypothetical protein